MASIFEQSELIFKKNGVKDLLLDAIWKNDHQKIQYIFNSHSDSYIQEILRSEYYNGRAIFDPDNLKGNAEVIEQIRQKADKNTYAFWKGKKTLNSLYYAVQQGSLKKVHDIFNSNSNSDIQKVLTDKVNNNYTILDYAISRSVVDIIKALWQEANEDTRVFLSNSAIKLANKSSDYDVKKFIPEVKDYNRKYTEKATKQTYEESNQKNGICGRAIQKVENLERTSDLHHKLRQAIDYLDVKKVKAVLEDCDTNLAMILNRPIHLQSKTTFLLYPLQVGLNKRYIGDGKRLKQEDLRNIKEITKLLWDKASPDIRNFWFKFHQDQQEESTKDTKATFEAHLKKAPPDIRDLWLKYQRVPENQGAAVIKLLKGEQQRHAKIGSEKWLEDFIQEVKDYREQKTIEENLEIATEKPTTKSVLQDAQLSQINRTCCIL
ncbi:MULTISPECIES: hypothetical protein [unclassified Wolbachia]|uniref:hypothetical protein n=1 Tax=unclassified Wolbachia TaxID=2640676 RepID=UPI00222073FF|nr:MULTISPECIES: hypothetical protein [unclassified Wolbachia]